VTSVTGSERQPGKVPVRGLVHRWRRQARPRLEVRGDQAVVHCGHHKVGTVWFQRILSQVAERCGRRFVQYDRERCVSGGDIVVYGHSRDFDPSEFHGRPIRGTHMVRDPRDVAVSAYHYHLWTDEKWARVPRREFRGRSYQEELRSLDPERGLLLEIEQMCTTWATLNEMLAWDYQREGFLELRYEDLVEDEVGAFAPVFKHYGLTAESTERALEIVDAASFRSMTGRDIGQARPGSHLRSGRPGQWREHFLSSHVERWNELAAGALVRLGYEADDEWGPAARPAEPG
jgi:hypothetical protein